MISYLCLFSGHSSQVPQIALVSHQHDDNVCVGMVAELFQPACDVLVGLVLGDVVDKEGADCATVVSAGDGAVALLAGGIPDLSLDGLVVDLDAASSELHADGGLAVEVEFVAGETREKVGFTNARVSDKDHFEEELRMFVSTSVGDRRVLAV
jgi:L-ascorbate metabolism protein UlaG (beta-lactamase superfamily)